MRFIRYFVSLIGKIITLNWKQQLALLSIVIVSGLGLYLVVMNYSTSSHQPLYTNMSREDIGSISRILSERAVTYETEPDQGAVLVAPRDVHIARLILAERGLPAGQESGFEVFDSANSLGISSLISQPDAVRIARGELQRNINATRGIISSKVHITVSRRKENDSDSVLPPSATVILNFEGTLPLLTINSVRNLVASAVPGLTSDAVTLVGANGVLISKKSAYSPASSRLNDLERDYAQDAEQKISAALGAYLGFENLRISVSVKLNSDEQEINELRYDPDSKVERSVQIVREAGETSNSATARATSVDQNLPDEETETSQGNSSKEDSERREELTNYEINRKSVLVSSKGYRIEKMSAAVIVNETRLKDVLGSDADEFEINEKLSEIEEIVRVALQILDDRGDVVKVSAMPFYLSEDEVQLTETMGVMDAIALHFGNMLNALSLILGATIFSLLAFRPILNYLQAQAEAREAMAAPAEEPAETSTSDFGGLSDADLELGDGGLAELDFHPEPGSENIPFELALENMANAEKGKKDALEQLIDGNEQRAVAVIQSWIHQDQSRPA